MEIDHPPHESGESVQKHGSSVWETRPTLIPITVTLREGLPKREVQIMHPLRVGINTDFTRQQAQNLAKETHGDQSYILKQLDGMNRMFKDGDKRALDPKLTVLTLVVPIHYESYCVLHRCLWDLHTPLAMIDMYCEEILRDIGLGYTVAHELANHMKSVVEGLRKVRDQTVNPTTRLGSDILIQEDTTEFETIRFPVVLKTMEEAERLKETLQNVDFGMEGTVLRAKKNSASLDAMHVDG